jgi:phage/plasmid-like protein (TIGR03299 family)
MSQIKEILEKTGLDWTVRSEMLQTTSGILLPNKIAVIREDTGVPLGDHKKGYTTYQNEEFLELLFQISRQTGLALHSGGLFGQGEKVWFQLKSDDLKINGDRVEGFISGINSFDGSTSLSFGNANKTISCMNTFWFVYKNLQTKIKHSVSLTRKIDEILMNIDKLVDEEKNIFRKIEILADFKVSEEVKTKVLQRMFDISHEDALDPMSSEELSTYKKNRIEQFYIDLNGELQSKDSTIWGLFSGVTKYTTHSMKKGDNSVNKIFGRVGEKERMIFNELYEYTQA